MSLSMKAMGERFGLLAALVAALLIACAGVVLAQSKSTSTGGTAAVPGTTIEVTTQEDEDNTDGDCSLREAITAADTNAAVDGCAAGSATERDAIHFALGEKATITLGSLPPDITDDAGLTINGKKAKIKVSGDDSVRVFTVQGGAKLNLNHLTVADGSAEFGGGLLNDGGEVKVRNSTFSGNSALQGGGIANRGGMLWVTNSTFSGNSADLGGGGIVNIGGTLEVTNSTFSGNSALSGGALSNVGAATFKNTIVANSPSGGNCTSPGPLIDAGYNIEDGTRCGFSAANNSKPSTEPKLDALADNGGPTQTHALKPASPAINAIPSATNGCGTDVTTDQRGVLRPQAGKCEIGSFEDKSPWVKKVVPSEDATGVGAATNVNAVFSEEMRLNSINTNTIKLFKVGTTTAIGAQVSYDAATRRAILNPNANLELGTRYKAVVTTGVRDLAGNRLDQDQDPSNGNQQKVWFFRVRN